MRHFELKSKGSAKFWSVKTDGRSVTVHFGRIGTVGREKTKKYSDNSGALREADNLIRQKLRKGYVEKGASGSKRIAAPGSIAEAAPKSLGGWTPRTLSWEHEIGLAAMTFTPDGARLLTLSSSARMKLRIWGPQSSRPERIVAAPGPASSMGAAICVSPDSRRVVSGYKTLRSWDVRTGAILATFTGHRDLVTCIDFSPDGGLIVTSSEDKSVRLWNSKSGRLIRTFEHAYAVGVVQFQNDGRRLITCCDRFGQPSKRFGGLQSFDLNGQHLFEFQRNGRAVPDWWSFALDRNGTLLFAIASDGTFDFWNLRANKHLRCVREYGLGPAKAATFTSNGKWIVAAHEDITAVVDAKKWKVVATFEGHTFALTRDDKWIAHAIAVNEVKIEGLAIKGT